MKKKRMHSSNVCIFRCNLPNKFPTCPFLAYVDPARVHFFEPFGRCRNVLEDSSHSCTSGSKTTQKNMLLRGSLPRIPTGLSHGQVFPTRRYDDLEELVPSLTTPSHLPIWWVYILPAFCILLLSCTPYAFEQAPKPENARLDVFLLWYFNEQDDIIWELA